jgi:cytohesin
MNMKGINLKHTAGKGLSLLLLAALFCVTAFCGEIQDAARDGDLEKVKALLKDNPDLVFSKESHGWTALHFAAANGYTNVTEFLLASKADVNAINNDGGTPLHLAVLNGYTDVAELLRQHGGQDTGKKTATTIHDAAADGNLEIVRTLLKDNPDLISSKDTNGDTPLHWAADKGHKDVAAFLLGYHADVNAKGAISQTPLFCAVIFDHADVVELLLADHADVNAKDDVGSTPLHYAVSLERSSTKA